MQPVLNAIAIYLVLLVIFRVAGRRMLAQLTNFDLVLLLIISEATQQALVRQNNSFTNALLVIATLISLDIALSLVKRRWGAVDKWIDGAPMIIVEHGQPLRDRMHRARVDERDVLAEARHARGLERMDQIKYAVLEASGKISVITYDQPATHAAPSQQSAPL